jgi:hypothetical protein
MTAHKLLLFVPTLALAGCGSHDDSPASTPAPAASTQTAAAPAPAPVLAGTPAPASASTPAPTEDQTPAPRPSISGDAPEVVGQTVKTPSGLEYIVLRLGTGPVAKPGELVTVNYTGWLTDGTKFDSSIDRGQPFQFGLGQGQVIPGWDQGVAGMKVGEKRKLIIPPDLGYGPNGAGNVIPPNSELIFEVDLLNVQ